MEFDHSPSELITLAKHDPDEFNRWEASQKLIIKTMISGITNFPGNKLHPTENPFIVVLQENLSEPKSEPLFLAEMMTVPNEQYILEVMGSLDPEVCHEVRNGVRQKIGSQLRENLYIIYDRFSKNTGNDFSRKSVGERALKSCFKLSVGKR